MATHSAPPTGSPAERRPTAGGADTAAAPRRTAGRPAASDSSGRLGRALTWATTDRVWLVALLALTFGAASGFAVDQTDYWWTVKLGEGVWVTGTLPAVDPLAFTSTRLPYVEQQWLAQVILAATQRLGGLEASLLLRGALLVLAMGLLFATCRRAGANGLTSALAGAVALLLVLPGAATRPQLLAIPLFSLFLLGTSGPPARWTLLALPLAMVIWVNVHGSFPMAVVLVGIALGGRALTLLAAPGAVRQPAGLLRAAARDPAIPRLLLLLVLCGAAVLVNPYGLALVPWLVDFLTLHTGGKDAAVIATEWLPTSIAERAGLFYFASVGLLAVALVRAGPPDATTSLRLLAFGFLGLVAVRNSLWWGLVLAPALAWALSQPGVADRGAAPLAPDGAPGGSAPPAGAGEPRRLALNALLIAALVLAAASSLPAPRAAIASGQSGVADPSQPRAAADHLAGLERPGRLFNYLDWGGYLAYRLAPAGRIFVDGRFGIYPHTVYADYFAISRAAPGWEQRLAAYAVDTLVLQRRTQSPLAEALAADPAWQLVYCDSLAAMYRRAESATGDPAICPSPP